MRPRFLLWLALLPRAALAFRTAPLRAAPPTCLRANLDVDKLVAPKPEKRRLLPRLAVRPPSALARPNEDGRRRRGKQLLKLGVAASSALLLSIANSPLARAATPLLVTKDGIAPLIAPHPGLGLVRVPGVVPPYGAVDLLALPIKTVRLVALGVVLAAALLSAADEGLKLARLLRSSAGSVVPASLSALSTRMLPFVGSIVVGGAEREEEVAGSVVDEAEEEAAGTKFNPHTMLFERTETADPPREVDWGTYARSEVDPLKKKRAPAGGMEFNPRTLLFERTEAAEEPRDAEETKLQQAAEFYRELKDTQHRRPVHAPEPAYLDGLSINAMEARDAPGGYLDALGVRSIDATERRDAPKGYLDALGDARASTWDAYQRLLDGARPAGEVDELKEEVSALQSLVQIEHSMHRASRQALKRTVEAQAAELRASSANEELQDFDRTLSASEELQDFDRKLSTNEEMEKLERKSREYEETVAESVTHEETVVEAMIKGAMETAKGGESKGTNLSV